MSYGKKRSLKFVTDPIYGDHLRNAGHPESPERVEVVAARLRARGILTDSIAARDATDDEIRRVHTDAYLALLEREVGGVDAGLRELSTGDVFVDAQSLSVARRAAGGVVAAVQAAAGGEPVFALVRPPGHHAEPTRGMGFCLLNNVAIAARAYRAATGGRVLIADFDYHHGNGTEAIAGDGISYVSTHAYPAYPGTGRVSYRLGADIVANVPLPASGISTEAFVAVWEWMLPLVAGAVRPDLLVVSAGFDYVAGDPVGDLGVEVSAAAGLAEAIEAAARRHCDGRLVYALEGGYGLDALTESIALIAAAAAAKPSAASGTDPDSIPPGVRKTLSQISCITQGGEPGAPN